MAKSKKFSLNVEAEEVMYKMINWVLDGEATIKEAIEVSASQIQTTL